MALHQVFRTRRTRLAGRLGYSRGERVQGKLATVDAKEKAELGVVYEDISIPARSLKQEEQVECINRIWTEKWFEGARVNWVYADERVVRCQFSYPPGYLEPATIIAILIAIAAVLFAVASIMWAYNAYRVITVVPPEWMPWLIGGSIFTICLFGGGYFIRSIRGK